VEGNPAVGERQGQKGQKGATESDIGTDAEEHLVRGGGNDVFLDKELDAISDGLQPAELAADASGTEPVLNATGDLALQPDEKDRRRRHEPHQDRSLDDRSRDSREVF